MALKVVLKDLSEVEEALRAAYTKVGDEYVLDTDDGDYKSRLSEFRNNNIDLNKRLSSQEEQLKQMAELKKLAEQYNGIDPEQARAALEKMRAISEQKLIDAGKLDEVLAQRTERMRSDYDGKIKSIEEAMGKYKGEADTYKKRLTEVVIDNSLQGAVQGVATVRKGAMRDILSRGREVWSLNEEGQPVPTGSDGKVMYGTDGKSTLSMEEWAQSLVQEVPYLFEPSQGGGSAGGRHQNAGSGARHVSITDQSALNSNLEDIASGKVVVGE